MGVFLERIKEEMVEVIRYSPHKKQEWNLFIDNSKNGTFLFNRNFMDYHSDRFVDFSLMIYRKGKLISCLPANVVGNEIYSHQGLTYGGFIFDSKMRLAIAEDILESVINFYKEQNIDTIYIKQIPSIYHKEPSNEMDYWLWRKGANVYRKDTTFSVDLSKELRFSKRKFRYSKKAINSGLVINEDSSFSDFWLNVLEPNLLSKYNVKPVHSVSEIELLRDKFPEKIKQFNVYDESDIVAGVTIFEKEAVIHAQYISATSKGTKDGALDFLFKYLIEKYSEDGYHYFDFGISNENDGKILNSSLAEYKEGFGSDVFIHEFYKLTL
jgi:hypothetical protein